jgi:hypothetical protein
MCFQSFFGAGFALFSRTLYHNLGVPWATSLLGFIALALAPVPVFFLHHLWFILHLWQEDSVVLEKYVSECLNDGIQEKMMIVSMHSG